MVSYRAVVLMKINLYPVVVDEVLCVVKQGDVLTVNGEVFDFSIMGDGGELPQSAISSAWFIQEGKVSRTGGELELTLRIPLPSNYSPEQAFPEPLLSVPDGRVSFPQPLPDDLGNYPELPPIPEVIYAGVIDWTQLITKAMKDAAVLAAHLVAMKAELAVRNTKAVAQIARIQDRVDTLGYGIDAGEATEEDEAEQAALLINLKAWKAYKFALGKVTAKASWPANPEWPVEPVVPVIAADPMARAAEAM